jgi:hypothetical protein
MSRRTMTPSSEEAAVSRLVDFYRGEATDSEGRFVQDIWSWGDEEWEEIHDFIQWLFPLLEPSRFNADAPLLTQQDMIAFQSDEFLRANVRKSFERTLTFLGLSLRGDGTVVEGTNFSTRTPDVWSFPNHNFLRITRVLRSLRLPGLIAEAEALYARLDTFYRGRMFPILADTFCYWTEAVKGVSFQA